MSALVLIAGGVAILLALVVEALHEEPPRGAGFSVRRPARR